LKKSIAFVWVPKDKTERRELQLKARIENARTIPGTHTFHCFRPTAYGKIETAVLSSQSGIYRQTFDVLPLTFKKVELQSIAEMDYVAVVKSNTWAIGQVISKTTSSLEEILTLSLMEPVGPAQSYQG
jgi:hypothetical protein